MNREYHDLKQSYGKGEKSFLLLERGFCVLADIAFQRDDMAIKLFKRIELSRPITPEDFADGIAEIGKHLKKEKPLCRDLIVTLPPSFSKINILAIPKTKGRYIEPLLRSKFGVKNEEGMFRFKVLDEIKTEKGARLSVLACSAPPSFVRHIFYHFEGLGFRVKCISHPIIGVTEMLKGSLDPAKDDLVLAVDISTQPTTISIYHRGDLEHVRILQIVDSADGEEFLATLSLEIKRSLLFCKQNYSGRAVGKILFTGAEGKGGEELLAGLERSADCPVAPIRIASSGTGGEESRRAARDLHRYLPCMCGFFLLNPGRSGLLVHKDHFNFASSHSKSKSLVCLLLTILFVFSFFSFYLTTNIRSKTVELDSELEDLAGDLAAFKNIESLQKKIETLEAYYGDLQKVLGKIASSGKSFSWPVFAVVDGIPKSSCITSITLATGSAGSPEEKVLTVVIRDDFKGPASYALEESIRKLKESGLFNKVDYEIIGGEGSSGPEAVLEEAKLVFRM